MIIMLKWGITNIRKKFTTKKLENKKATPEGFEPSRAKPNGLAGRRLNHSAKVSYAENTKILSFNIFLKLKLYLVFQKILFSSRLVGRVV